MWIFTSKGFFSVVEDRQRPGNLLVRARFRGDIQDVFGKVKVDTSPARDYRFRTSLPRHKVTEVIAAQVHAIDYSNFKNTVRKSRLHDACSRVWNIMFNAQQSAARRRPAKRQKTLFSRDDYGAGEDHLDAAGPSYYGEENFLPRRLLEPR